MNYVSPVNFFSHRALMLGNQMGVLTPDSLAQPIIGDIFRDLHRRPLAQEKLDALLHHLIRLSGRADFGQQLGRFSNLFELRATDWLGFYAPTLGDALALPVRYPELMIGGFNVILSYEADVVTMQLYRQGGATDLHRCYAERMLASISTSLQVLFPEQYQSGLLEVGFAFPEPIEPSDWGPIPVRYNQPWDYIRLNAATLSLPMPGRDDKVYAMLEEEFLRMVEELRQQHSFPVKVKQFLMRSQPIANLVEGAAHFHQSERTFRRKLQQHGTTFRELVQEVQLARSEKLLANGELTVEQIAHQLGYVDGGSFVRAFRKWLGMTPGQYRQQLSMAG